MSEKICALKKNGSSGGAGNFAEIASTLTIRDNHQYNYNGPWTYNTEYAVIIGNSSNSTQQCIIVDHGTVVPVFESAAPFTVTATPTEVTVSGNSNYRYAVFDIAYSPS